MRMFWLAPVLLACCGNVDGMKERRATLDFVREAFTPSKVEGSLIEAERANIPVALANTTRPLVMVEQPGLDLADFFVLAARSGDIATYGSSSQASISFDGPVMVATRGFGADLMSGDAGSLPDLLAARQSGQYKRVVRYLDGENQTISYPVQCNLEAGDKGTFVEYCGSPYQEFRNVFELSKQGKVVTSIQWHGPDNSYLTIRRLR
ncbi:hypothetical protein E2L05_08885 [Meridianimarinicoccus aquatilis]|uniref:YjbF family lipoprotein n=2 Tax=Meridianimarinicoccus aquatilis TaxID=2552766 RepID=A0A4R6AVJ9_9RHOB|nr:hypothetical protein E2L05_08885 [Fluviibacterium aquatile]